MHTSVNYNIELQYEKKYFARVKKIISGRFTHNDIQIYQYLHLFRLSIEKFDIRIFSMHEALV